MGSYRRLGLGALWIVSLVGVAHWTAHAQAGPPPGVEVRFVRGQGQPGALRGTLLANFNGQWLPVTLDMTPAPDPNWSIGR